MAFAQALLPVLMTDGTAISSQPFNRDTWKILFVPHMSACPVGFVWPVGDGFEEFHASATNRKQVSQGFLHLLKTRKTVIDNWFKVVQESPERYAVPAVDALPLWSTFPTNDDPDGDNHLLLDKSFDNHLLLDKGLLVPFQEQSHSPIVQHHYNLT